jgi:hypothetical protein
MLKLSNNKPSSQFHAHSGHSSHLDAGVNSRRPAMLKRTSILMLIAASALATTALMPTDASARGFGGGGFRAPANLQAAPTSAATSNRNVARSAVATSSNRNFTRSTANTGNSPSTTTSAARKTTVPASGANVLAHNNGGPLGSAKTLPHKSPLGTGTTVPTQPNQGDGKGNQTNQGGTGTVMCFVAPCPSNPGNQTNQGGSGNQVNQSGTGNTVNQTINETNITRGGGGGGISIGGGAPAPAAPVASAPASSGRVYSQGYAQPIVAASRITPPPASCFRKNNLPDGGVLLIDDCTKQQVTVLPGGDTCLQTEDAQAGSVWFADMCGRQQVLAPPAAAMEALSLIYKKVATAGN